MSKPDDAPESPGEASITIRAMVVGGQPSVVMVFPQGPKLVFSADEALGVIAALAHTIRELASIGGGN